MCIRDRYDRYPDVRSLADAKVEDIERIVKPCGLGHSKARDISACMKILQEEMCIRDRYYAYIGVPSYQAGNCNDRRAAWRCCAGHGGIMIPGPEIHGRPRIRHL